MDVRGKVEAVIRTEGISKAEFGRRAGISRQNLERYLSREWITPGLYEVLKSNGYDVEIVIRKK